mmetsp:Transcript_34661/g.87135  ORF Transcript_34661/g.87135 Transcript_34661/m.87135 type:complete len:203 (+) Transcript_34661:1163-1771(+)
MKRATSSPFTTSTTCLAAAPCSTGRTAPRLWWWSQPPWACALARLCALTWSLRSPQPPWKSRACATSSSRRGGWTRPPSTPHCSSSKPSRACTVLWWWRPTPPAPAVRAAACLRAAACWPATLTPSSPRVAHTVSSWRTCHTTRRSDTRSCQGRRAASAVATGPLQPGLPTSPRQAGRWWRGGRNTHTPPRCRPPPSHRPTR